MRIGDIKKNLTETYDDLAASWGEDETGNWGQDYLIEFAKLITNSGGVRVLDLGCGSGIESKALVAEGLDITGIDLSPKMIDEAKNQVPDAEFIVGDMTNMSFSPDSFDGVFARASLLHIPKKIVPRVMISIHKILKNKGYLYAAVKKGKGEGEVEEHRHDRDLKRFFSFFQEKEILGLLKNAGFEILSNSTYKRKGGKVTWIQILAREN